MVHGVVLLATRHDFRFKTAQTETVAGTPLYLIIH